MNERPRRTPGLPLAADVTATVAVAAYSLAAAAGFARVFSGWQFMTDMVIIVIVGHGAGLVLRRTRFSGWIAVPITVAIIVWTIAALFFRDTFAWGLPTTETWSLFRLELSDVREQFRFAVAPVVYGGGWDVLAAIGIGIAVVLADVFAFRALARAETLVPGGVLFVFVGALGDDRLRVALAVLLVGVGVLTTVVLRGIHSPDNRRGSTSSIRSVAPAAVVTTLVVALAAGCLGPRIPGADAAPLYETRGGGGTVTDVVSPLVDIRSRLTNRSTAELFQVSADAESYWRAATLSDFDGTVWRLPEQDIESADATQPGTAVGGPPNTQVVTIVDLGGSLVPAAPEPREASGPDDLRWIAEASTLVTIDGDLDAGDTITVVSESPQLDAALLGAATSIDPPGSEYTSLPEDLPSVVQSTAEQVTADADSTYEAAILLQTWFREFEYSLEVQAGHGNDAIETFLRNRVGYCEQFAGTYAAMMRSLGYPARVAVGFTSGSLIADDTYSVAGRNAHAWPEVWFDDIGWVAFEPTPGRGAPNAESYNPGITPQQAAAGPAGVGTEEVEAGPTPTVQRPLDPVAGLDLPEEFADPTGGPSSIEEVESTSDIDWTPFVVLAIIVLIAIAPAVIRRVRARATGGSTTARIGRLWTGAVESVRAEGVPIRPSDTPLEAAQVTARHLPLVARPMTQLARAVTEVAYRPEGAVDYDVVGDFGTSAMRQCQQWSRQIDRAVDDSSTVAARLRRYFTVWK